MEELRKKLEEESKRIELQKGVGFPLKNLINHVVRRAENDEAYRESVLASDFVETLIYVVESFQKIIVETEDCIVPDDDAYQILDEWYERSDEREALLKGIGDTKHKQCSSRNIFISSSYLAKSNIDKMQEDFKNLTAVQFLIKKYYKEPVKSKYTPQLTKTASKPVQKNNQLSLDLFGTDNADTEKEENNVTEVSVEEPKSEEVTSPALPAAAEPETKEAVTLAAEDTEEVSTSVEEDTETPEVSMEQASKEEVFEAVTQAADNAEENIQAPLDREEGAYQVIKPSSSKSKRKEVEGQFDLFGLL